MLVASARRCRLITRLRSEAMTCGAWPVRTWDRWVQGVGGDHHVGQVERGESVQQRGEPGDLAGLAVHADLAEHHPSVLVDAREQVPGGPLAVRAARARAADGLTVDGQRAAPTRRAN